jgi:hypothetical protein
MSAIDNTPVNRNFLSPLNFRFQIKKAPNVNFFIQKVNIPSISITNTQSMNPLMRIPYSGDHLDYGDLSITFKVDEDLNNYLEVHNWLIGLGKPKDFDGYKMLQDAKEGTGDGLVSDISIILLSSTKMPNFEINYTDAFPVSLSGISFNTVDSDVNYLEATATFKYQYYDIVKI